MSLEKKYYRLDEAAAVLSARCGHPMNSGDALDLACRGKIRLCFWFDGDLFRFARLLGPQPRYVEPDEGSDFGWHVAIRGYVLIPQWTISPNSKTFVFDEADPIELVWRSRAWRQNAPGYVLGRWDRDDPSEDVRLIPFNVSVTDVLVPTADIGALVASVPTAEERWDSTPTALASGHNPAPESLTNAGAKNSAGRTAHLVGGRRSNSLNAVIGLAQERAADRNDYHSVWGALVKMAESRDRQPPLIGYVTEGVQYAGKRYQDKGEPDVFTKEALRKRMNPSAR